MSEAFDLDAQGRDAWGTRFNQDSNRRHMRTRDKHWVDREKM
jgi:hypothetical protein